MPALGLVPHISSHAKKLRQNVFLACFTRCASIKDSAKRAKVDRREHYRWLKEDPEYAQRFRAAIPEAADAIEDALAELAIKKGNVQAAMFLLKGLRPEKYKDRQQVEWEWDGDPAKLTDAQLTALLSHVRQSLGPAASAQAQLPASEQTVDVAPEPVKTEPTENV